MMKWTILLYRIRTGGTSWIIIAMKSQATMTHGDLSWISRTKIMGSYIWSVATEASDGGESNGGETKRYLLCQGLTGEYSWFAQIESEGVGIIDPGMNPLHNSNGTGIRVVRSMIMNEKNEWEEQK